jgi:hypothetical protein
LRSNRPISDHGLPSFKLSSPYRIIALSNRSAFARPRSWGLWVP